VSKRRWSPSSKCAITLICKHSGSDNEFESNTIVRALGAVRLEGQAIEDDSGKSYSYTLHRLGTCLSVSVSIQ
jgi:hypothetical protein